MPNTGKSTLYNRLTGGNALIANWPGLTVELMRGPLPPGAGGESRQLVDLPGIHDLEGHSADEAVVKDFLHQASPDLVLVVINAQGSLEVTQKPVAEQVLASPAMPVDP
jgi:ferrous iron transport protein B